MKDEALKQVLEAITQYLAESPDPSEEAVEGLCDAASAARKALAQSEQEYHAVNAVHKGQQCYVKAQLEQEPVAWYVDFGNEDEPNYASIGEKPIEKMAIIRPLAFSDTTPPQRTEQNFCQRCGKRKKDLTHIHTCTPPQEGA